MKIRIVTKAITVFWLFAIAPGTLYAVPLFNGVDLSGWTYHGSPWVVSQGGILQNTGIGNGSDWIEYNKQLPVGEFIFEIRMRVVDCTNTTPRHRIILVPIRLPYQIHDIGKIYFGNEGFNNHYEIYGIDLSSINQVGDDSYVIGQWYTLRFEVNEHNQVSFFKDAVLTHTATRIREAPLNIIIRPGDDWSAGHIEISSVTYIPVKDMVDFDCNGRVDFKDFSILAQYWRFKGESSVDVAPLFTGDGMVDYKDLAVFAENWLWLLSTMQASNPNPADGATGIGIDAELSWTPIDEAALHEVYFGSDPYALPLVATQPVGQESYDPPGDLIPGTTYYWWIVEVNDAGPPPGKWPGVLWSFTTVVVEATNPSPPNGSSISNLDADLSWTASPYATSHDVYFGTNPIPSAGEFQGNQTATTFDPGTMAYNTTYYWRIDEVSKWGTVTGTLWSFTTPPPPPP